MDRKMEQGFQLADLGPCPEMVDTISVDSIYQIDRILTWLENGEERLTTNLLAVLDAVIEESNIAFGILAKSLEDKIRKKQNEVGRLQRRIDTRFNKKYSLYLAATGYNPQQGEIPDNEFDNSGELVDNPEPNFNTEPNLPCEVPQRCPDGTLVCDTKDCPTDPPAEPPTPPLPPVFPPILNNTLNCAYFDQPGLQAPTQHVASINKICGIVNVLSTSGIYPKFGVPDAEDGWTRFADWFGQPFKLPWGTRYDNYTNKVESWGDVTQDEGAMPKIYFVSIPYQTSERDKASPFTEDMQIRTENYYRSPGDDIEVTGDAYNWRMLLEKTEIPSTDGEFTEDRPPPYKGGY